MSSPLKSVLILSVLALTVYLLNYSHQVSGNPVKDDEPDTISLDDGSLFPVVVDCKEDEKPAPGKLQECEPTCDNPRPACNKMFYSSLDFVPCFCKQPLVRNKDNKKCVRLEECPSTRKLQRRSKSGDE